MRCFPGIHQIDSIIRGQRPVIMFTGTIDSRKRFFMKQAGQAMMSGNPFQRLHHHLVVVNRHIDLCIDRSQLMLSRSRFIVLRLGTDSQTPHFFIDFFHKSADTGTDTSEIMVVHLLAFRRHGAKQSPVRVNQIFSLQIFFFINQKIFLFRSHIGNHPLGCGISK